MLAGTFMCRYGITSNVKRTTDGEDNSQISQITQIICLAGQPAGRGYDGNDTGGDQRTKIIQPQRSQRTQRIIGGGNNEQNNCCDSGAFKCSVATSH